MLKPMCKTPFIKKGSKSNNVNSKMRKKVSDTETSTAKSNVNDCFVKVEHLQIKSSGTAQNIPIKKSFLKLI